MLAAESWTLEPPRGALYAGGTTGAHPMLALFIILGFVAVLALINFVEFGRVD